MTTPDPQSEPSASEHDKDAKVDPKTADDNLIAVNAKPVWSTPLPGTDRRLPYWGIWVVALAFSFVLGWGISSAWGATQWGPAAAWFSGMLTAGAVSVSLWQAFEAKRKSEKDARAAEKRSHLEAERHAEQLKHANDRLQHEIDAQRRHQQLMSIPPIWHAIGDLAEPTKQAIYALVSGAQGDEAARERARDLYSSWQILMSKAEISFTTPSLIIYEVETMDRLNDAHRALLAFKKNMGSLHNLFNKKLKIDQAAAIAVRNELLKLIASRGSMVETATREIGGVIDYMLNPKQ